MTEQNLKYLSNKSDEVYVFHRGKIMSPGTIGHLRNSAIVPSSEGWFFFHFVVSLLILCLSEGRKEGRYHLLRSF